MALITVSELTIGFRGPLLLDGVSCQIERGQRIGLMGRNGAGKTTFMRILSGQVQPDDCEIALAAEPRVALLPQDIPHLMGSVSEVIASGFPSANDDHEL